MDLSPDALTPPAPEPEPAQPTVPAATPAARPLWHFLLIAAGVVALDQVVKLVVKLNMAYGEEHPVLGSFFRVHFIENDGAAFGLTLGDLFGWSQPVAKVVLTLFSLVLVGFIGYYLNSVRHIRTGLPLWIALILGGAFGNIIDRLFYGLWFAEINNYEGGLLYGRVVDMFYLHFWQGILPEWFPVWGGQYKVFDFAIFNIADAAISVGIVVVLLFQRRLFGEVEKPAATKPDTSADAPQMEAPTPTEAA